MKIFRKSTFIKCELEALFDFHLDVANLKNITPKDTHVTLLNEDFIPVQGAILKLKTVKNFVPIYWEVEIQKLERPNILVDVALKSPFAHWKHEHKFFQRDGGCELEDVVTYELPLGWFGALFNFLIKHELDKMFTFRHEVSIKLLEGQK